jgi:hypothetical protein
MVNQVHWIRVPGWWKACQGIAAMVLVMLLSVSAGTGQASEGHQHQPSEVAPPESKPRTELGASVAIAPDGVWYAVAKQEEYVVLYRSQDGGGNWQVVSPVNREAEVIAADGENRPKLAIDNNGAVYVSWARRFEQRFTGDVRFARAPDGVVFEEPLTVHQDRSVTGHSFNSMLLMESGQILMVWIDGRDRKAAENADREYRGSAIYAALSDDGGRSFNPEVKISDYSCQCCRLAVAMDVDGAPLLMWRHIFEPNVRDHVLARLRADGTPEWIEQATFDGWQVDGCPHHGPSLAVTADGARHAVWFNQVDNTGQVFYGQLTDTGVKGQRKIGGMRAAHADIAVAGERLAIVWKEFDGVSTQLHAEISTDSGANFDVLTLAATQGASDQPRVLRHGERLFVFWHTEKEGMTGYSLP